MGKNQDLGSGINIPDPQHWVLDFRMRWFNENKIWAFDVFLKIGLKLPYCVASGSKSSEYSTGTDLHRSRLTLVHMRLFRPYLKKNLITVLRAKMYTKGTVTFCIRYVPMYHTKILHILLFCFAYKRLGMDHLVFVLDPTADAVWCFREIINEPFLTVRTYIVRRWQQSCF
jgi:hypothetical protein